MSQLKITEIFQQRNKTKQSVRFYYCARDYSQGLFDGRNVQRAHRFKKAVDHWIRTSVRFKQMSRTHVPRRQRTRPNHVFCPGRCCSTSFMTNSIAARIWCSACPRHPAAVTTSVRHQPPATLWKRAAAVSLKLLRQVSCPPHREFHWKPKIFYVLNLDIRRKLSLFIRAETDAEPTIFRR